MHLCLAAPAGFGAATALASQARTLGIHEQLLELVARQERERCARFLAVKSKVDLDRLQRELREAFLRLLDGLPTPAGAPPHQLTGKIEADDYVVEKLVYESFPSYFVPAMLYRPRKIAGPLPGVLSPCGHSINGKAAGPYQILHINLAKRRYVVLTYDPVGQRERSQLRCG